MMKKLLCPVFSTVLMICFVSQFANAVKRAENENDAPPPKRARVEPSVTFNEMPFDIQQHIWGLILTSDPFYHASLLAPVCKLWANGVKKWILIEDSTNTSLEATAQEETTAAQDKRTKTTHHKKTFTLTVKSPEIRDYLLGLVLRGNTEISIPPSVSTRGSHTYYDYTLDNNSTRDNDIQKLTNLISLVLPQRYANTVPTPQITNNSLSLLTRLTSLNLGRNNLITDESLSILTNLRRLHLPSVLRSDSNSPISNNGISMLTNLTSLHLGNTRVTGDGFGGLTNLISLCSESSRTDYDGYYGCYFITYNLNCLTNLTKLKGDVAAKICLKHLSHPTDLDLVKDISTLALQSLDQVTRLRMRISFEDRGWFTKLSNLIDLETNKQVTDTEIKKFIKLQRLSLRQNDKITEKGVLSLTNLTDLAIGQGKYALKDMLGQLPQLTALDLSHGKEDLLTNDAIKNLTKLIVLKLGDRGTHITDEGIQNLTNLTLLKYKNKKDGFTRRVFTWRGFAKLKKLEGYTSFYQTMGLPFLKDSRNRAQEAYVAGQNATDAFSQIRHYLEGTRIFVDIFEYFPDEKQEIDRENYRHITSAYIQALKTLEGE